VHRRRPAGPRFALACLCLAVACKPAERVSAAERRAIADSLTALVTDAYDLSRPDAAKRLIALYPDSGRVISAAGGRVITTQGALASEIESFWRRVGRNMQEPRFVMGSSYVDVITRDAAVMTFTYSIAHRTPEGAPHTVSGAWTTFWRRGATGDGASSASSPAWRIVQEHLSDAPPDTTVAHDMH